MARPALMPSLVEPFPEPPPRRSRPWGLVWLLAPSGARAVDLAEAVSTDRAAGVALGLLAAGAGVALIWLVKRRWRAGPRAEDGREPAADGDALTRREDGAGALGAAAIRYEWYRDGFRGILALLLVTSVTLLVAVGMNVHLYSYQPPPKYFLEGRDGRIVEIVPLDQPSFSDQRITQWVTDAVVEANKWNFADYREALQKSCNTYFTPNGCQEYRDALVRIGNLESVKTKRLNVSAVVTRPPIIVSKVVSGQIQRFRWNMQMEIAISYLSSSEQSTQNLIVNLTVVRRALTDDEQGVGIEKYVANVKGVG